MAGVIMGLIVAFIRGLNGVLLTNLKGKTDNWTMSFFTCLS